MGGVLQLARPEIRELQGYTAASYESGLVRLNANETPWAAPGDTSVRGWNNYPEARPATLSRALAEHYGVDAKQLLVTRGSSEAIDLLIRGFCTAGKDSVVICPPTFEMYRVYADVQGAKVREIPLLRENDFALPVKGILNNWTSTSKMVFVCSPNNPTGNRAADADLQRLCEGLTDRGLVVVDAAYTEFADTDPTQDLLARYKNVVVLRTLSKAFGLAGVRCGALLGPPALVDLLARVLPPYSYPTPCQDAALECLKPENRAEFSGRIASIREERSRLLSELQQLDCVKRIWPSEANFLLAEVEDARDCVAAAHKAGLLIRDFSYNRALDEGVRITVGTAEQNDRLLESLKDV
ncbi:MAG: histidinol-phosphate transaminase [Gammaproteobacteria bacterium]